MKERDQIVRKRGLLYSAAFCGGSNICVSCRSHPPVSRYFSFFSGNSESREMERTCRTLVEFLQGASPRTSSWGWSRTAGTGRSRRRRNSAAGRRSPAGRRGAGGPVRGGSTATAGGSGRRARWAGCSSCSSGSGPVGNTESRQRKGTFRRSYGSRAAGCIVASIGSLRRSVASCCWFGRSPG